MAPTKGDTVTATFQIKLVSFDSGSPALQQDCMGIYQVYMYSKSLNIQIEIKAQQPGQGSCTAGFAKR